MTDRTAYLCIIWGLALLLSGCCGPLLSAYEADQKACLTRYYTPEDIDAGRDIACVKFVRFVYEEELEAFGCD